MQIQAGQVAVVTGGASGIGFALAARLGRSGMRLALADLEVGALEAAVARLTETGVEVIGEVTDVSRADDLERLRDRTLARYGRVDIVCNNAGVSCAFGPIWSAPLEDWRWVLDVNLWGVIHGIRSFVPLLAAQRLGHVVNVASMAGLAVLPYNGVYNASKHAVVSITETLRAELDDQGAGVGATVVCPGRVATRISEASRNRLDAPSRPAPAPALDLRSGGGAVLDASAVADQIIAAIEINQLYLATNPGSAAHVARRMDRITVETANPL